MTKSRVVAAAMAVVAIVVIAWLRRSHDQATAGGGGAPRVASSAASSSSSSRSPIEDAASRPEPPPHVRRLTAADRRQLADQITAARARARAKAATNGATPATGDDRITLEQVSTSVRDALEQAIPMLAECYPPGSQAGGRTAAVEMMMTSDPDIGTVIDAEEMRDQDGKPLDPALDDCLRKTIESLGLPPLGAGGTLPLTYSFVFP